MSTLAVNTITNAAGGNTAQINGMTPTADSLQGFRNRILNGGMVIDQRNAGASLTNVSNGAFITDRFQYDRAGLGITAEFTASQSTDAPTGFRNSLKLDTTTAQTLGASGGTYIGISHKVEGFNMADLAGGTATLSFRVKATKTGTYSVVLKNSGSDQNFVGEYTVSASNTWEEKTVSIPAIPTAGTWNYTNGTGLQVFFCLAVADDVGTATIGSWISSNVFGSVNNVEGADNTANDFYITGVQLEAGSVATPFERRPYGTELALCQRYYYQMVSPSASEKYFASGFYYSTGLFAATYSFPVTMRTAPTLAYVTGTGFYQIYTSGTQDAINGFSAVRMHPNGGGLDSDGPSTSGIQGAGGAISTNNAAAAVGFSAEL
jgi:hypothetical protein